MPAHRSLARLPLVTSLLVIALVAMACGAANGQGVASLESAAPNSSGNAAAEPSLSPEDAAIAFAECMREHGVDMPDPQFDADGGGQFRIGIGGADGDGDPPDRDTLQTAMEACRELLPEAGGPGGRELTPEDEEQILAFTECMREHGIDMPDPQFGDGGGGFIQIGPGEGGEAPAIDPNDPDFQAAQEACRELLPGFGLDGSDGEGPNGGPSTNESTP